MMYNIEHTVTVCAVVYLSCIHDHLLSCYQPLLFDKVKRLVVHPKIQDNNNWLKTFNYLRWQVCLLSSVHCTWMLLWTVWHSGSNWLLYPLPKSFWGKCTCASAGKDSYDIVLPVQGFLWHSTSSVACLDARMFEALISWPFIVRSDN